MALSTLPGFIAANGGDVRPLPGSASSGVCDRVSIIFWGVASPPPADEAVALSRVVRRAGGAVPPGEVTDLMRRDPAALTALLPPFGAVVAGPDGVRMVADSLGFQHLFHSEPGRTTRAVMASPALRAGGDTAADLDRAAVGVQSLLGWQLGQRTLFEGIRKLDPGATAHLDARGTRVHQQVLRPGAALELDDAVARAAAVLRISLAAVLDEHPEAVLQLTGGMDSRLLLSAIPRSRRRGLRAMTLDVPGAGDVAVATALATRYGIRHDVHGMADLDAVTPSEAWMLACADSVRLDAMADPVALAAQRIAERAFDQGVRLSGLGGEVARGFYYVGRVEDRRYTRKDAEQLASWRMFVNDAVEGGVLTDEFAAWSRDAATEAVYSALRSGGDEWFRATDALYLGHRMQRWAGATDIAVADQRHVINPMLDHEFLGIAARVRPQDKAHARFLARLQMELDPELGAIPLDGRPAPSAYANPGMWRPGLDAMRTGTRWARKAMQRVQRGNRPPAGGTVLAAKVVEHWRDEPGLLEPLATLEFLEQDWIDGVLTGRVEPRPSSVAFLTNLVVATTAAQT